jgi:hypothetical protein
MNGRRIVSAALALGKIPIPTYVEAGLVPVLVWMCSELKKKSPPTGIQTVIPKMSLLLFPVHSMQMIPTIAVP